MGGRSKESRWLKTGPFSDRHVRDERRERMQQLLLEIDDVDEEKVPLLGRAPTWRIISFSKWSITMVIASPLSRVVGPLPNGING